MLTAVLRTSLPDIFFHHPIPPPLSLQDILNRIPQSTVSTGMRSDVVRLFLHFNAGVSNGNGEPAMAHGREIDDIIADKCRFTCGESLLPQNFLQNRQLVLNTLMDVV